MHLFFSIMCWVCFNFIFFNRLKICWLRTPPQDVRRDLKQNIHLSSKKWIKHQNSPQVTTLILTTEKQKTRGQKNKALDH